MLLKDADALDQSGSGSVSQVERTSSETTVKDKGMPKRNARVQVLIGVSK